MSGEIRTVHRRGRRTRRPDPRAAIEGMTREMSRWSAARAGTKALPVFGSRAMPVLGLLAVVLVAGACSSSGNKSAGTSSAAGTAGSVGTSSAAAPPTSGTSSAAPAGTPIEIGVVCSCSGPFGSTVAAAGDVAQAWVKSVNAAGGVQGHPVDLTVKDDGSNPGTAATDAQSLIAAHVDVILDLDVLDATWEKAVDAAKIPVVGGNFSSEGFFSDPNFYPSGQTQDSVVVADVTTLKAAGAKRVGQLYCAESPSCAEGVAPRKKAAQAIGLTDAYDGSISATAPNYTAQCLAAKQAHTDGFHIGGSASTMIRIAQDCGAQGYHPIIELNGTAYTDQLTATPELKNSLWASFPVLPYFADNPELKRMDAAVDQYYPGLRSDATKWSEYAEQSWTAGLLIEDAMKGSGLSATDEVTPAAITSGLNSIHNDTLNGLAPPLTFTAGKPHSVDCWYTARLRNGTPTLVDNGKLTCSHGGA